MTNSQLLHIFAQANKNCGYDEYADMLDSAAAVYEAEEAIVPSSGQGKQ